VFDCGRVALSEDKLSFSWEGDRSGLGRVVGNPSTTAHPAQGFGSMPMRSLTADRIRCLQPRYRSVV
jgi:hypothetical protein